MAEKISREFRSTIDLLSASLSELEAEGSERRSYYGSANFLNALECGEPAVFRSARDPQRLHDLERFGGRELLRTLSEHAHALLTRYTPRLSTIPGLTLGYAGSRRLRTLLTGVSPIIDLESTSGETNSESLEQVDLVIVGIPLNGDPADLPSHGSSTPDIHGLERLLGDLSSSCRRRGIPLVMLTSGATAGLEDTALLAPMCDLVVTFGDRSVGYLQGKLGAIPEVWQVPPFFSPVQHGPIGRNRVRFEGGLFWGEWPSAKQAQRRASLHEIFEAFAAAEVPLALVDPTMYRETTRAGAPRLPWQFARNVIPEPDPRFEPGLRKMCDFHVIANLHPGQPWSFPLELLPAMASGSVPIATYSVGMNNEFPNVMLADSGEDVALELNWLRGQPEVLAERQALSVRRAFERFTADRFLVELTGKLGLSVDAPVARVDVQTASPAAREEFLSSQQIPEHAAISVVPTGQDAGEATIRFSPRAGIDYGPHALLDIVNGFRMSSADAVTIGTGQSDRAEEFDISVHDSLGPVDAVWCAPSEAPDADPTAPTSRRDPLEQFTVGGGQAVERAAGPVRITVQEARRDLTVVVPVYNNGRHLESKCFASLQRSSIFPKMHIHLVDDGSSDQETTSIVGRLGERYPNVETHFFETGGSGSASRPRNYGLEQARTEYITYLDPDNEATGDGYARLLDRVRSTDVDFAIGNMVRLAKSRTMINNVDVLRRAVDFDIDGVGRTVPETVAEIDFQPMSIQALIADTEWLRSTGIQQPVGALGQDSLFFQMMLHAARSIAILDEPIHSYYGEVAGSMVNTVTPGFFRKYLPLERARSQWLRRSGLHEAYSEVRARPFFRVWFWPRFNERVVPEYKQECFDVLHELAGFYGITIKLSADGQTLVEVD